MPRKMAGTPTDPKSVDFLTLSKQKSESPLTLVPALSLEKLTKRMSLMPVRRGHQIKKIVSEHNHDKIKI